MKSFKKSIVFLMVAALVFGTVAPAFAATPTDVLATTYEDAVGKLVALGVINGYEDGTFAPDKTITRAEFAKIATYVVGQQDAANLSKGSATKFSDVSSTHWASGFISVASNQGLLKGYPNGTFKPEANVTYAEAITILVRALGMSPVVEGKGTWPANYMAKAAEVGMFDDVTGLTGNDNAVRGNIAKLAMNTMESQKWAANGYNDKGEIQYGPKTGVTLLSDRYKKFANATGELDIVKDATVDLTRVVSNSMNDNAVTLTFKVNGSNVTDTFKTEGLDMSQYLGCKVDFLRKIDGSDKFVTFVKAKSTVVNGKITEIKAGNKLVVNGKEYELSFDTDDSNIMLNYNPSTTVTLDSLRADVNTNGKTVMARLVVDPDTNKATMSIVRPELAGQFVVREVKSNNAVTNPSGTTEFDLDTITDGDVKDKVETVFVKNGKAATKSDIKPGDVVVRIGAFVFITDNKVTGKVAGISSKNEITVNGVKYTMSANAQMTKNGKIEDADPVGPTITDYLNKDVTLSLNSVGDYVLLSGSVVASAADQFAMVSKAAWEGARNANGRLDAYIELRSTAGDKKVYLFSGSQNDVDYYVFNRAVTGYTDTRYNLSALAVGTLVKYQVAADGSIDPKDVTPITTSVVDLTNDYDAVLVPAANVVVNDDAKSITDDKGTHGLTSPATDDDKRYYFSDADSVILNNKDGVTVEKASNWDSIVSSTANVFKVGAPVTTASSALMIVDKDTRIVKVLAIAADTYVDSNDKLYGIVTVDPFYALNADGKAKTFVKIFTENAEQSYEVGAADVDAPVTSDVYGDAKLEVGDFVVYTLSDGKLNTIAERADKVLMVANDDNDFDTSYVKSFADSLVIFDNDGGSARLDKDVVVYDASGSTYAKVSTSEIKTGVMGRAIDVDNDGLADAFVILSK